MKQKSLLLITILFMSVNILSSQVIEEVQWLDREFNSKLDFIGSANDYRYILSENNGKFDVLVCNSEFKIIKSINLNKLLQGKEKQKRMLINVFIENRELFVLSAAIKIIDSGVSVTYLTGKYILESFSLRDFSSNNDRRIILNTPFYHQDFKLSPDKSTAVIFSGDYAKETQMIYIFDDKFKLQKSIHIQKNIPDDHKLFTSNIVFDQNNHLIFLKAYFNAPFLARHDISLCTYSKAGILISEVPLLKNKKKLLGRFETHISDDGTLLITGLYNKFKLINAYSGFRFPIEGEYYAKIDYIDSEIIYEKTYNYSKSFKQTVDSVKKNGLIPVSEAYSNTSNKKINSLKHIFLTPVKEENYVTLKTFYRLKGGYSYIITMIDKNGNVKWIRKIPAVQHPSSKISTKTTSDGIFIIHNYNINNFEGTEFNHVLVEFIDYKGNHKQSHLINWDDSMIFGKYYLWKSNWISENEVVLIFYNYDNKSKVARIKFK